MKKLTTAEYTDAEGLIRPDQCGAVYPYSVTEGFQTGDVYLQGNAALIWHQCGFAFLCGDYDTGTLSAVYETFLSPHGNLPRRFVLFADSPEVTAYFSGMPFLTVEERIFFAYSGHAKDTPALPDGFRLAEINGALLAQISGRITPAFSWESAEQFLQNGRGFCVLEGDIPAAWSFSAAVSQDEIDIGIETDAAYRQRGLAKNAAGAAIRYALEIGKKPVWACHAGNTASARLALSLGFAQTAKCCTIRKT